MNNMSNNINDNKENNGKQKKFLNLPRLWVQAAFFALSNGFTLGFLSGSIFKGKSKAICAPGLNCYSCPGALFACPIGSLQTMLGQRKFMASAYVFGLLMTFGSVLGRFVCGWLCPFGLVQDLLHKIPIFKKVKNLPGHKYLVYLKYVVLVLLVILFPLFLTDDTGMGRQYFCELVCPSGTLLGGLPIIAPNELLQQAIGSTFIRKAVILVIVLLLSIKVYRPFCKYLCPLGAFYGMFNPISAYRLNIDELKCVKCGKCSAVCKMGVDVVKNANSPECIRCGDCKKACPTGAISSGFCGKTRQ